MNRNFFKYNKNSYKISKSFKQSIKYALSGLSYCFKFTRNFRIQLLISVFVILAAFIFELNGKELMLLISTISSVLILELLNTSIESVVDLIVDKKFSKLAKISKDCSAAAVLMTSFNAIFVAVYIFLPKIKILLIK